MTPQELKYSILHLAFTGKLSDQNDVGVTQKEPGIGSEDPPIEIPETWTWQTLSNCCEMYTGNSISEGEKNAKYAGLAEGYDYIATKDVSFEQTITYENGVRIPYNNTFKRAHKNSILMCIEGGSAGRKLGILDRDVCFGNKLCMFRAKEVLNTFVFYYLQSASFKKSFSENMTGIIGGVSIKKLKEILMPIPPLTEQIRIVAKIEELLPYIDRYELAWSKLETFNKHFPSEMQKSILQMAIQGKLVKQLPEEGTGEELYQEIQSEKQRLIEYRVIKKEKTMLEVADDEKPFDIPKNWKWIRLGLLTEFITSGSRDWAKYYANDGDFFLRMGNLSRNSFKLRLDNIQHVQLPQKAEGQRTALQEGDLLFSITGEVGMLGLIPDNFGTAYINQHTAMIRFISCVRNTYIPYLLLSDYAQKFYNGNQHGIKNSFRLDSIANLPVPLPPLAEQKRIISKLEKILPLCEKLK